MIARFYYRIFVVTRVLEKWSIILAHSSTRGLMGPTCLELNIVAMLILLSSKAI